MGGKTGDNKPAFILRFEKTENNNLAFKHFTDDFIKTKSYAQHLINPNDPFFSIKDMEAIPEFFDSFLIQNGWADKTVREKRTPISNLDNKNIISKENLLHLKKKFYLSVDECKQDAFYSKNEPSNRLSNFVYNIEQLTGSIVLALQVGTKDASNNKVFHIH